MRRTRILLALVVLAAAVLAGSAYAPVVSALTDAHAAAKAKRMPNVVNKALPAAERILRRHGIRYKTEGGGLFGIVIKGDWGVCATRPSAGRPVHGKAELVVGHYTCGA